MIACLTANKFLFCIKCNLSIANQVLPQPFELCAVPSLGANLDFLWIQAMSFLLWELPLILNLFDFDLRICASLCSWRKCCVCQCSVSIHCCCEPKVPFPTRPSPSPPSLNLAISCALQCGSLTPHYLYTHYPPLSAIG